MKVSLSKNKAKASVNSNGAYVDSFELANTPIFFPRVMVKIGDQLKTRGGMHPCAPNFGANKTDLDLDQHGFARDMDWKLVDQTESMVKLALDGIKHYEGVSFEITYELLDRSLLTSLLIKNNSNQDKLIAPGFHPYFYIDHKTISVNGSDIDLDEAAESIYQAGHSNILQVNGHDIEIIGYENVNYYVIWTDLTGDYICMEPTYMANSFADFNKQSYKLKASEEFIQKFEIRVM